MEWVFNQPYIGGMVNKSKGFSVSVYRDAWKEDGKWTTKIVYSLGGYEMVDSWGEQTQEEAMDFGEELYQSHIANCEDTVDKLFVTGVDA